MPSDASRYLQHIIENAEAIVHYTEGMTLAQFEEDRRTYDAVERCLQRITEAVIRLGDQAEDLMPGQPWQRIRGFGNRLRHNYDTIEEDRLFEIVKSEPFGALRRCPNRPRKDPRKRQMKIGDPRANCSAS